MSKSKRVRLYRLEQVNKLEKAEQEIFIQQGRNPEEYVEVGNIIADRVVPNKEFAVTAFKILIQQLMTVEKITITAAEDYDQVQFQHWEFPSISENGNEAYDIQVAIMARNNEKVVEVGNIYFRIAIMDI